MIDSRPSTEHLLSLLSLLTRVLYRALLPNALLRLVAPWSAAFSMIVESLKRIPRCPNAVISISLKTGRAMIPPVIPKAIWSVVNLAPTRLRMRSTTSWISAASVSTQCITTRHARFCSSDEEVEEPDPSLREVTASSINAAELEMRSLRLLLAVMASREGSTSCWFGKSPKCVSSRRPATGYGRVANGQKEHWRVATGEKAYNFGWQMTRIAHTVMSAQTRIRRIRGRDQAHIEIICGHSSGCHA